MKTFGLQEQLVTAVLVSIFLAGLAISLALFFSSQQRSYADAMRQSEEMVQAASMAFSRALAMKDEVLLDAYVHELQSREDLSIVEIYVLTVNGRVVAHSNVEQYGKTYPVPALLHQGLPSRLSEVTRDAAGTYHVVSMLQAKGNPIGVLSVTFSTERLKRKLLNEILWIVAAIVPILLLMGLGIIVYGRRMVSRLKRLQAKAIAVGRGEWGEPLAVSGADEISQLTESFNQMLVDLSALRARERESSETIAALNRDLHTQLDKVRQLKEQLAEENAVLRQQLQGQYAADSIIGSNGSLRRLIEQARQLASLPVTVMISGESGTGKELLARLLHESGTRRQGPFVSINCAALPVTLIESELFGHEKGAFTGATAQKIGKFELARDGTLFLDEVGELPLEAQAKLLRALQQGEIQRVGGNRVIQVDTRVIAATNRNLEQEVSAGRFRGDLYYRLNVIELRCPPLRERIEDIPALTQYFIEHYGRRLQKPVIGVSPSALELLVSYHWPGNIRELENTVARAVALAATQVLGPEDFHFLQLPEFGKAATRVAADTGSPFERLLAVCGLSLNDLKQRGWGRMLAACERICLDAMLERCRNQKEAAAALGLTPTKLHRLIRKYRLKEQGGASDNV